MPASHANSRPNESKPQSGRIDQLLQNTPPEHWPELVESPELRTYGAIEYLGRMFADMVARDARRALVLAELGISLSENLPETLYAPSTIVQAKIYAWKDLGTVLRFLCRPQQSVEALLTAESHIFRHYGADVGAGVLTHDLAIIHFSLAVTYQELGRFTESRELLRSCKAIFREHVDDNRFILCVFAEGIMLQRLRNYREAREIYLLLLSSQRHIEIESLAALHQAIGYCCTELEDFPEAEANLDEAVALNRTMGKPVEVLKIELGRGRLFIRRGDYALAIDHLRPIRREFLRSSMPEEAGIAGLEIVEALLSLGNTAHAETLARKLVQEFTTAKLNTRAVTALGYLTEAIAAKTAKAPLVTQVREYIVSLRTAPERDFEART
jgi:tetratricopeptide (TPR) repeat protein